jgi:hypothetical protein
MIQHSPYKFSLLFPRESIVVMWLVSIDDGTELPISRMGVDGIALAEQNILFMSE